MVKYYFCKSCNYQTSRHFSFKKHLSTAKHLEVNPKLDSTDPNLDSINPILDSEKLQSNEGILCQFCNKNFSTKSNLGRHLKRCSIKKSYKDEQIENELEEIKSKLNNALNAKNELEKDYRELEREYFDFMKKVSLENNTTINNNKTINNTINMYYVINNFNEALNYKELMTIPLTTEEKEYMNEYGPSAGAVKIISNRCLKDIELEKRPFHCVDESRLKYLLRDNNEWLTDKGGNIILNTAFPIIRDNWNLPDPNEEPEKYVEGTNKVIKMESVEKYKILKELNKKSILKNNFCSDNGKSK